MSTATASSFGLRAPNRRFQVDDAVQAWKRSGHRPGTLLLLDPEPVADDVARALARVGVHVDRVTDAAVLLDRCEHRPPQAVVMSARTPVADPGSLVFRLRQGHRLPVLLALGSGDVEPATPAIVAGAEPVLDLPLRPAPLLQHLQRVWQDLPSPPRVIRVGTLELDEAAEAARASGRRLALTPAEFDLLWRLAVQNGRTVRREDLWPLWPAVLDRDGTLVAAVVRLRRKLAYAGIGGAIRTVRGIGYRLDVRDGAQRRPMAALHA